MKNEKSLYILNTTLQIFKATVL